MVSFEMIKNWLDFFIANIKTSLIISRPIYFGKKFKPFRCGECGHFVTLSFGPHKIMNDGGNLFIDMENNGNFVPCGYKIPDNILIPTCQNCGEFYVPPELENEWDDWFIIL